MSRNQKPRLRFAPSPTGHLHIGGARTALFNWLLARKEGGTFILRLEDTDRERSRPEFEDEIIRDLRWLGLDWDEGPQKGGPHAPYRQSERGATYQRAVEDLLERAQAYRCTCSMGRLDAIRKEAMAQGRNPHYDGHCRDLHLGPDCGPHVVRFKMPQDGTTVVQDMVKGPIFFENQEMDDFVIRRTDGGYTYNFVVVLDDHHMGITAVLRGDDHLSNTPKQVQLYEALGALPPRFGHMPLILGPDGKRLSKRHGATSVGAYRDMGYLPQALLNYLARLGWAHGDQEIFTVDQLVEFFSLAAIGKAAGRWSSEKLDWVNQYWMQNLPITEISRRAAPFLKEMDLNPDPAMAEAALDTVRSRSHDLRDMVSRARFFFLSDNRLEMDPRAMRKFLKPAAIQRVEELAAELSILESWNQESLEDVIHGWLHQRDLKLKSIAQPIRICVTGQRVGPGLFETLEVLGKDRSLARIRNGIRRAREQA